MRSFQSKVFDMSMAKRVREQIENVIPVHRQNALIRYCAEQSPKIQPRPVSEVRLAQKETSELNPRQKIL
jgi:hypothetical protein